MTTTDARCERPGARGQVQGARRDDADCLSNLAEAAAGSMDRTLPSHSGLPTWHGVAVWVLFLGHALRAFEFLCRQRTGSPGCDACAARVMLACRSLSSRTHPAFDASYSDGHLNTAVAGMPTPHASHLARPFPNRDDRRRSDNAHHVPLSSKLGRFPRVAPVAESSHAGRSALRSAASRRAPATCPHEHASISRNDAASFSCISPTRRASSRIRTGAASTAAAPFGLLLCLLAGSLMSASCIRLGLTLHLAGVLLLQPLHRTKLPPSCISQCQLTKPHRAGGCARNSDESLQPTHRRGRGSHVEAQ
ncbi:hypothetical protein L1887_50837 [Cichorium endivia]|nr:hypothetical protein L1887_50837 [Cichorium endivia]